MLEGKFLPMLCWIFIFGGLLIMMGRHDRSEALFYYFRLEDQVPETLSLVKTPRCETPCESAICQTTSLASLANWFQDVTMLHSIQFQGDGVLARDRSV
jgi:hypothetical protein